VSNPHAKTSLSGIRLVAFDVDGVFTDGRFYLSNDGVESKAFNTQDGYGIRQLLETGIEVAVISGRSSAAVEQRMAWLNLTFATSYRDARTKSALSPNLPAHSESLTQSVPTSATTYRICRYCAKLAMPLRLRTQ
jgi:3-deoxy-D-manno-octulosonate 8-phosphate phosphatase KdsC-like HAD superfamily phosphatase